MMRKNLDRFMNKPTTKIVILTLTNWCNLSCSYCYEHNKNVSTMSVDTAIKILKKEMSMKDGSSFVCVYYFGGEPFSEFETICQIHSFLKKGHWDKGWFGFATTNGTLVHGDIQNWLHDNQDTMEVYLSLDGTKLMHNINRSNSYDRIDVGFFLKEYPFAKMTVTSQTLPNLAEGIIYLHNSGFQVSANLGYGIDWLNLDFEILSTQLTKLIDFYLINPSIKPATLLDQDIMDLEPESPIPKRFCGIGSLMKAYDTDGRLYPCHAFSPLSLGENKAISAKEIDFSLPLDRNDLDEKCRYCPIVGSCPTCYGINYSHSGNIYRIPEAHCKMMKVLFLANAMFKYKQYELGQLELTKEKELKLLRNIRICQRLSE